MSLFNRRTGMVNVKMVITEEKILSNIDKIEKLINPNSKKQIIELKEDTYFKDLVESIKLYLVEYPKKKNFPKSVYKGAYDLVEYATNQFEENTKQIEELIRQRESNIGLANELKGILEAVEIKEPDWKLQLKEIENNLPEDMVDTLLVIGKSKSDESEDYKDGVKLVKARIANLEANLHIEIDMERIEDRSKALSYIGIEIAEALKIIPTPTEDVASATEVEDAKQVTLEDEDYVKDTTFEVKPTLWQRFKNAKLIRAITYIFRIKVVLQLPALPEGRGENTK